MRGKKTFKASSLFKIYSVAIGSSIAAVTLFYILISLNYGFEFEKNHRESQVFLRNSARAAMDQLVDLLDERIAEALAANTDSSEHAEIIHFQLKNLSDQLEQIAITDRSSSLDNIFERFSVLVTIATLLFAVFGIFNVVQYRDEKAQLQKEYGRFKRDMDKKSKTTTDDFEQRAQDMNKKLDDAEQKFQQYEKGLQEEIYNYAQRGNNMIWLVANSLEKLLQSEFFQNVDSDKILKLLEELYLEGFRLDLVSPDRKERFSALQNIWAQGNCDDLKPVLTISKSKEETVKMQNFARYTYEEIIKRCPHPDGHPELDIPEND